MERQQEHRSLSECAGLAEGGIGVLWRLFEADLATNEPYCSSTSLPSAYSKRFSFDRNDRPSRFSDNASSGSTMASTSRTVSSPISIMAIRAGAALMVPLAVLTVALYSLGDGRRPNRAADLYFNATTEAPVSTMKSRRWPSIRPLVWKCPRASLGMLRLRMQPSATVSVSVFVGAALAAAGTGVHLSAICAM